MRIEAIMALLLYTASELIKRETYAYSFVMLFRGLMQHDQKLVIHGRRSLVSGLLLFIAVYAELSILLIIQVMTASLLAASFLTIWALMLHLYMHWKMLHCSENC